MEVQASPPELPFVEEVAKPSALVGLTALQFTLSLLSRHRLMLGIVADDVVPCFHFLEEASRYDLSIACFTLYL